MKKITLPLMTRDMSCYYYQANSNEKRPGIIFLPDLTGIQEATHQSAKIIAAEGNFNVIIPDLYSGSINMQKYCVRFLIDEAIRNNHATNNAPLNEFFEILDQFKAFDEVDEEQMGVIGQCLTGGFVLHAAIRPEVKAPVVFHHSFGRKGSGFPKGCAALVQNKIQGHFVHLDPFCPASRIKALEEELGDKLEDYKYWLPHGIPHLFFRNKQAKTAFDRMMSYFETQLK
ncbi:MAG: dienelactone hydrolase family protein [Chitinophagales bacterium]|nr:dienelactone hydrolase family protein [Chitinophagales bacterium]